MRTSSPRLLLPALILFVGAVVGGYALLLLIVTDTKLVRTAHRGVEEIVVTAHSHDIELVGAPAGAAVEVTRHVTKGFESPRREESLAGGRLKLDYSCGGWPLGRCGIRYVISVPPGTRVVATSGSGEVVADGLRGARLDLRSGSGDVVAHAVSGPRLALESGSGDLTVSHAQARSLAAQSGSGDIVLDLAAPAAGLRATSGSGDVIATLPDVGYALQVSAPGGGFFSEGLRQEAGSSHRIDIESGSGEVRLVPVE